ncbi:MAG: uridine monophosphate kinase [Brevinema sp.]
MIKYKRVLLKISGEVLAGDSGSGFDEATVEHVCSILKEAYELGCQLSVVCGAGNIMRGAGSQWLDRFPADQAGMLGTAINTLVIQNTLQRMGVSASVCGSFAIEGMIPKLTPTQINETLKTAILIFAGGTGAPFFSTDTTGVLKALETSSDLMIKATKVDGVYCSDPLKNESAKFFAQISYSEILEKKLKVMDLPAISLAMENHLPLRVTDIFQKDAVTSIIKGQNIGTLIC